MVEMMSKKKLLIVTAVILLGFSLISWGIVRAVGRKPLEREDKHVIVTSFYPVYVIAENLLVDVEGEQLVNLTENQTGCLHDYQLTTSDMLMLESADLLLINGGEMELFVMEALKGLPELPVIDSCETIVLLQSEPHHHGEEAEEDDQEELAANGHVWMDFNRYLQQIAAVTRGLSGELPQYAETIAANSQRYQKEVTDLQQEYEAELSFLAGTEVILFHDAFYYLCEELGMEVIHSEDMDADTALSAGEVAEITDEIRLHGIRYLLAEEATGAVAEQIAAETGCQVVYLNPITSGSHETDAYLKAMRENMEILRQLQ